MATQAAVLLSMLIANPHCSNANLICQQIVFHAHWTHTKEMAIQRITECGGTIVFHHQRNAEGAWLPNAQIPGSRFEKYLFGKHFACHPIEVQLFKHSGSNPKAFGDRDSRLLTTFTRIKWLVLMDTNISDKSAVFIKQCKSLERLDVEGTAFTADGAIEVRRALPKVDIFFSELSD